MLVRETGRGAVAAAKEQAREAVAAERRAAEEAERAARAEAGGARDDASELAAGEGFLGEASAAAGVTRLADVPDDDTAAEPARREDKEA